MQEISVGRGVDYGSRQPSKAKVQTVIVSIPPAVKRHLSLMASLNSVMWVAVGLCFWLFEGELPVWAIVGMSIGIFVCVIGLPWFISFISKVPWGQEIR